MIQNSKQIRPVISYWTCQKRQSGLPGQQTWPCSLCCFHSSGTAVEPPPRYRKKYPMLLIQFKVRQRHFQHKHSLTFTTVTFGKIQRKQNFAQVKSECTYDQLYMYIQGSPTETQNPTHWNMTGHTITAYSLCNCLAVLFCHIRLIALSFTYGKIWHALKKRNYFVLF
jgi:hypothetical protein